MKNENVVCENCENKTPIESVLYDSEGVYLCRECYDELKCCPEFYEDGVVPEPIILNLNKEKKE